MSTRSVTTASNLYRRHLCPASQRMEAPLPPEPPSMDSIEGTILHHACATNDFTGLESEQEFIARTACQIAAELRVSAFPPDEEVAVHIEKQLMLGEVEFGKPDVICISGKKALIIDYKFGRVPVDQAESNLQLRAYTFLVAVAFGCEQIYAAIIQPRVGEAKVHTTLYDKAGIASAALDLGKIMGTAANPDAPFNPSKEACNYCRARYTCKAAADAGVAPLLQQGEGVDWTSLPATRKAELLRMIPLAKRLIESWENAAKEELKADSNAIPGFTLKPGATRRTVTDALKAYNSLAGIISSDVFASCCTVKLSNLESAVKAATGKSAKEAKEAVSTSLANAGCLEVKQSEPSLVPCDV